MSPYEIVSFKYTGRDIIVVVIDQNKPDEKMRVRITPEDLAKVHKLTWKNVIG